MLWWKGNFATLPVVLLYFDFFLSQFCESGLFWNFKLMLVPSCRLQLHPWLRCAYRLIHNSVSLMDQHAKLKELGVEDLSTLVLMKDSMHAV